MKKKVPVKAEKETEQNFVVVLRTADNLLACGLWFTEQREAESIAKKAIVSHKSAWDARLSQMVPVESAYVCKVVSEASIAVKMANRK